MNALVQVDPSGSDERLDSFALAACQEANLGNSDNWFLSFRGGLYGARSRVHGARYHSALLHGAVPRPALPDAEHHVSTILFCMDSALECFVFMLNALGQAVQPDAFRPVNNSKQLRQVGPLDVLEDRCPGYKTIFPQVRERWQGSDELLRLIMENHDVAKHRTQSSKSGTINMSGLPDFPGPDAPVAALSAYMERLLAAPMTDVRLPRSPKLPVKEQPNDPANFVSLEELEAGWEELIVSSFALADEDARAEIELPEPA